MDFYQDFITKIKTPEWSAASEQVRCFQRCSTCSAARASHLPLNFGPTVLQILVEPYTYLAAVPGKEVRSALIAAFNEWMHVPEVDLNVVKKLVGMLHTASLL